MSRSSVCRCVLAVLAALLALPAIRGWRRSHRGGTFVTLATDNAGTADPQVNATPQYWHLFQVTQDGLTAFRKTPGPAANSVVADLATRLPQTTDGGRTWTLTLRRGVRYSNGALVQPARRPLHVRAAVQGARPDGRVALRRARRRRGVPAGPRDLHARARRRAERARTITFHLTRPDTEWPQKLALPPAALLPPSVGDEEIGTDVSRLVGTGPYYWASYAPSRQLVLRRNPHFKVWAPAAQPDGYVDRIVQRFGLGAEAEVTEVERGQADWVVDDLPPDRLPELLGRYASQLHVNQLPADWYVALNVNIKPFDEHPGAAGRQPRDRPRRDRQALRRAAASPRRPARCSRRASPATRRTARGRSAARRPGRARTSCARGQLVDGVRDATGARVDIVVANDAVQKAIGKYIQVVLFKLGFDPRVKALPDGVQSAFVQNSRNRVEAGLAQWQQEYPAPSELLDGLLGCDSFVPGLRRQPQHQRLLRPRRRCSR